MGPFNYSLYNMLKDYIMDNLLDKSLLNYKAICNALCYNILESLNIEHNKFNLRIVKERLVKARKCVTDRNIPLKGSLIDYYVNTNNNFAILIAIIKMFNIDDKNIFIEDNIDEIINLIGTNWLLLPEGYGSVIFEPVVYQTGSKIQINLTREIDSSHYQPYQVGDFDIISCEDNIIKEIKLYSYQNEIKKLKGFLFKKLPEIVDLYKSTLTL